MAPSDQSSPFGGPTPAPGPPAAAHRRSPLAHVTAAAKRSLRDAFSKQQLLDGLKAFLWVAPLTILIWIYAEREQLSTQKNFRIPIEVRSADPRQVITVTRLGDRSLTADLVGPRAQIDRVREEFVRSDARARIEIGNVTPGPRQVPAESAGDDGRFAGNGVMLNNIQPRVLDVYVDVLDDVEVPVGLPPGVTNIVNPVFNPPVVKMTAPRSAIEKAMEGGGKPLVAFVDPTSFQQLRTPGQQTVKNVRVKPPLADENARLLTTSVEASFEVKQADVERTISSVPVWVTFAPGVEQKYRVSYEPTLSNVTVVGPADQIAAIDAGTATPRPKATFEVSSENVAAGTAAQKARVKYDLPDGVHIKPDQASRTIDFQLVERTILE